MCKEKPMMLLWAKENMLQFLAYTHCLLLNFDSLLQDWKECLISLAVEVLPVLDRYTKSFCLIWPIPASVLARYGTKTFPCSPSAAFHKIAGGMAMIPWILEVLMMKGMDEGKCFSSFCFEGGKTKQIFFSDFLCQTKLGHSLLCINPQSTVQGYAATDPDLKYCCQ